MNETKEFDTGFKTWWYRGIVNIDGLGITKHTISLKTVLIVLLGPVVREVDKSLSGG